MSVPFRGAHVPPCLLDYLAEPVAPYQAGRVRVPEPSPVACDPPCPRQRRRAPVLPEGSARTEEERGAQRHAALSHGEAHHVNRLLVGDAAYLPGLEVQPELLEQQALQLPCRALEVPLVSAEEVDIVCVPQLVAHQCNAPAAPVLAHTLYGVVAERQHQLRHAQREVAADLQAVAVGGKERCAQVEHIGAAHVAPQDAHHHISLDGRVTLAHVQVDVIAALLYPPVHGAGGHELPLALYAGNLPEAHFRRQQAVERFERNVVAHLLLDRLHADDAQLAVGRLPMAVAFDRAEAERSMPDLRFDLAYEHARAAVLFGNAPGVLLAGGC